MRCVRYPQAVLFRVVPGLPGIHFPGKGCPGQAVLAGVLEPDPLEPLELPELLELAELLDDEVVELLEEPESDDELDELELDVDPASAFFSAGLLAPPDFSPDFSRESVR